MSAIEDRLNQMRAHENAASVEVARLCSGGRWEMHIPAREDKDSDLVITAGLNEAVAGEKALRAVRRVITETIEDVTAAYTDQSRSAQARAKSDVVRRVLMTLRDDTERAIAEALGVQP